VRIDRATDAAKWDEVAALGQPLVTQFEDGRTEGEGLASSSLYSAPPSPEPRTGAASSTTTGSSTS